jgi:hypothetical protein
LVSIIAETECDAANGTDQSCFHLLVGTPQGTALRPLGKKIREDISSEFRKLADRRMLANHVIACGECTIIKNPCAIFKSNSGQIDIHLFDQLLRGRIGPGMRALDARAAVPAATWSPFSKEGYDVFGVEGRPD